MLEYTKPSSYLENVLFKFCIYQNMETHRNEYFIIELNNKFSRHAAKHSIVH